MSDQKRILISVDYETRNLGISSYAIDDSFISKPDLNELNSEINKLITKHSKIFIQARIAKNDFHIIPPLQEANFFFVEATLVPYATLKKNKVLTDFIAEPASFIPAKHIRNTLKTIRMDKNDYGIMETVRSIAKESFTQDRFHIDHRCSREVADRRFVYWVDDLLADMKVVFYIILRDSETIGFMARKEENLILAGFSQKFVAGGLGDFLWLSVLEDMLCEGLSHTHTLIATNNIPVLNLYVRLGFKFKDPCVTLHYWS